MDTIGLLVFEGADLLDVGGPYEVFLTATRLAVRAGHEAPFEVVPVASRPGTHVAYGGLGLQVDEMVGQRPSLDVFIVPGLIDLEAGIADLDLRDAIRAGSAASTVVASVCTGAILLAHAGLLDDVSAATTHFEDLDSLAAVIGEDRVRRERWVDCGHVVTSGGLSSGMAMALHLVDRLAGRDLAMATARQLAYDWSPTDGEVAAPAPSP